MEHCLLIRVCILFKNLQKLIYCGMEGVYAYAYID
jgi:hypothetical protein